jgi:hypothetical protein
LEADLIRCELAGFRFDRWVFSRREVRSVGFELGGDDDVLRGGVRLLERPADLVAEVDEGRNDDSVLEFVGARIGLITDESETDVDCPGVEGGLASDFGRTCSAKRLGTFENA